MKIALAFSGLFLLAAPLLADSQEQISYADSLEKCQEFVNDPQLVQIKFKVSCFDEDYTWKETGRRKITQENSGLSGHRLLMKEKWRTPDFALPIIKDVSQTDCPVLSRFKTSRQAELVLTCKEFVENYSQPEDLVTRCDEGLANATAQTEPTGEQVDLCARAQ